MSLPIVRVEAAPGAKPTKSARGYTFPIAYVLADGTRHPSIHVSSLLRDAKKELASLPKRPDRPTYANFLDGRFVGASVSYVLYRPDGRPGQSEQAWLDACAAFEG